MQFNIFYLNLKTSNVPTRLRIGGLPYTDGQIISKFNKNETEFQYSRFQKATLHKILVV